MPIFWINFLHLSAVCKMFLINEIRNLNFSNGMIKPVQFRAMRLHPFPSTLVFRLKNPSSIFFLHMWFDFFIIFKCAVEIDFLRALFDKLFLFQRSLLFLIPFSHIHIFRNIVQVIFSQMFYFYIFLLRQIPFRARNMFAYNRRYFAAWKFLLI